VTTAANQALLVSLTLEVSPTVDSRLIITMRIDGTTLLFTYDFVVEPVGDPSFFQPYTWVIRIPDSSVAAGAHTLDLTVTTNSGGVSIPTSSCQLACLLVS